MNIFAEAFVALLLTLVALELHRTSKRAKTFVGDVVLAALCEDSDGSGRGAVVPYFRTDTLLRGR